MRRRTVLQGALALAAATRWPAAAQGKEAASMHGIAERYVKLVLALGVHDEDAVDAYYGPAAWRDEVRAGARPLPALAGDAQVLAADLERVAVAPGDELLALRHTYLTKQLAAVAARIEMLSGRQLGFDAESRALYDAVAPTHTEEELRGLLGELERALPGSGPLAQRYEAFREAFVVPPDKLDGVFQAAIQECRRRTRVHLELPAEESFTLEYVGGKPWSGYNWYQGSYRSLIQVNTDLPITIDRAVDLACHEGYPGHHVYNVLLERHLVEERGFVEFTVYPLFSPQSLVAEGTANYGIEVAFPGEERAAYEKRALFPLAGLDAAQAERYYDVHGLLEKLSYAGNEAARRYLEGRLDADGAVRWLETYTLASNARARQRVRFIERYRSYVINYNLGQDLVRSYIEARGGTRAEPRRRWEEFKRLLASPRLPGGLLPVASGSVPAARP